MFKFERDTILGMFFLAIFVGIICFVAMEAVDGIDKSLNFSRKASKVVKVYEKFCTKDGIVSFERGKDSVNANRMDMDHWELTCKNNGKQVSFVKTLLPGEHHYKNGYSFELHYDGVAVSKLAMFNEISHDEVEEIVLHWDALAHTKNALSGKFFPASVTKEDLLNSLLRGE